MASASLYLPLVFQITPSKEAERVFELLALPASAKGTSRPAAGRDQVKEIMNWLPPFILDNEKLKTDVPLVIVINAEGNERGDFGICAEDFSEVSTRVPPAL
jgi:hypothetical protein